MSKENSAKATNDFFSQKLLKGQKISIVNLGCVRNLVDSQIVAGKLKNNDNKIVGLDNCDVAIINTCAFIEDAKRESIEGILDLIDLKKKGNIKKIIVAGCLSERYEKELKSEFKEIDAFIGVQKLQRDGIPETVMLTPPHFTYIKICESCYNRCSFCVIPKIKGQFSSRSIESIVEEVKILGAASVKEINIVGQDITAYGLDIYKEKSLNKLIKEIVKVSNNIEWIRLLYSYPSHITKSLIDTIASEDKICKYIDMPLQHINDNILKRMKRRCSRDEIVSLINMIRNRIKDVCIRTTFIVGFPGETEEDFSELLDFVKEMRFDKLGAFIYSNEEGTEAYNMSKQIPEEIKKERFDRLMGLQLEISKSVNKKYIGSIIDVLIDGKSDDGKTYNYLARTRHDAPDVDGFVYLKSKNELIIGDIVKANIIDSCEYDLIGEVK